MCPFLGLVTRESLSGNYGLVINPLSFVLSRVIKKWTVGFIGRKSYLPNFLIFPKELGMRSINIQRHTKVI